MPSGSSKRIVDAAVGLVGVPPHLAKAGAFIDGDRSAVERRYGQRELGCTKNRRGVVHAGLDEAEAEALAGEVGTQAEPDFCRAVRQLEHEQANQLAACVVGCEVAAAPFRGVEQLGEIGRVGVGVIERVRLWIPPPAIACASASVMGRMTNPDCVSARDSATGLLQSPDGAERVADLADSAAVVQGQRPAVRDASCLEQLSA